MSCYVSHVYPDRLELLVDSAQWEANSLIVTAFIPKASQIPALPLLIACRGPFAVYNGATAKLIELSSCGSVDATLAAFQEWLREQKAAGTIDVDCDILIGGWSETRGAFHKRAVLAGACPDGELWELVDIPEFVAATVLTDVEFDDAGFDVEDFRYGLHHHGVRLMREARAKEIFWNGFPLVPVGGTLLLFEVTKDGHRPATPLGIWPDLIGQPMKRDAAFLKGW